MVITNATEIQDFPELTAKEELNVTSATLMAAAPFLGKKCENIFSEFMLCRQEYDPRHCITIGKKVTECAVSFFKKVKANCDLEFNQYAHCIDKSSTKYEPWHCRKTYAILSDCMKVYLCTPAPDFGYFTRGRIHKTQCAKPTPVCPCPDKEADYIRQLPDDFPRHQPRFGSRCYWTTE